MIERIVASSSTRLVVLPADSVASCHIHSGSAGKQNFALSCYMRIKGFAASVRIICQKAGFARSLSTASAIACGGDTYQKHLHRRNSCKDMRFSELHRRVISGAGDGQVFALFLRGLNVVSPCEFPHRAHLPRAG